MEKEKPRRVAKGRLLPLQRLRRSFGKQGKQFVKTARKPQKEEKVEKKAVKKSSQGGENSVQVFGRKKTATAVAHCKQGVGIIKVNGAPLQYVEPPTLRLKLFEPILLLGKDKFASVNIRVRVRGGGQTSRIYAIRQAICKSLVAYYQKYVDEVSKKEIKDILHNYDKQMLVADPRRTESKKFGGHGARARFQKSYR